LQLLEVIALGALIGLIVTLFIFYLLDIMAYALVLIIVILSRERALKELPELLKTFPKFTEKPVSRSDTSKYEVNQQNYIHDMRSRRVDRENRHKVVCDLDGKGYYKDDTNNSRLYTPKQPVATKLNKILNVVHSIILFYRRFYGCSTKVEKNLLADFLIPVTPMVSYYHQTCHECYPCISASAKNLSFVGHHPVKRSPESRQGLTSLKGALVFYTTFSCY